jgi:xylulose-5-phosphate/fructose-6-phosphate phosphoketolase
MNAYWRAANYLSVGQIYLYDNPLLTRAAQDRAHQAAPAGPLGHHARAQFHLRALQSPDPPARSEHDLHRGPGHGGPGMVANTYLEGTYSEYYPNISRDAEGMRRLSQAVLVSRRHPQPRRAGNARLHHEGGELGYSLLHAYGAVFDNPDLLACCVVGDGEAETGALATSWHSNKFLNPARDGACFPSCI